MAIVKHCTQDKGLVQWAIVLNLGNVAEAIPFCLLFGSRSRDWTVAHFKPAFRIGPALVFSLESKLGMMIILESFLANGHFFCRSKVHYYRRNWDKWLHHPNYNIVRANIYWALPRPVHYSVSLTFSISLSPLGPLWGTYFLTAFYRGRNWVLQDLNNNYSKITKLANSGAKIQTQPIRFIGLFSQTQCLLDPSFIKINYKGIIHLF